MFIDDEVALREWLVATLEPLCDAEPIALARYVLALVAKDKPLDKLRENCIDRLEVFLDRATKDFVDQLFDVIRNGRYIPEAKKENVQPKPSEIQEDKSGDSSELIEPQNSTTPTDQEQNQEHQTQSIPTTSQTTSPSTEQPINNQQQPAGAIIQPIKRRYPYRSSSNRHHSPNPRRHVNASSGGANRHQISSHYRPTTNSNNQRSHKSSSRSRSTSPPPAKRTQRSYSHSSSGSSSRSSPSRQTTTIHQPSTTNTNFLFKKVPCTDFFENKGYCALGDSCPFDHGANALVFEQQQQPSYYPSYQPYGMPPPHLHPHYQEYNPEAPDIKHGPHPGPPIFMRHPMHHHPRMPGPPMPPIQPPLSQQQMMINPQRTLVTVVTNAEPLPLEQKIRQNDPMSMPISSIPPPTHMKRHINSGLHPIDRRVQQHEHLTHNDSNINVTSNTGSNNNNNANPSNTSSHSNTNNGYANRGWKRPWQKSDGSGSTSATLEIRKIPVEFNTIAKLNEHFSKFGTVTNVQISYDGSLDSALVAYATFHEAETAYKNPQPLFNNRFIKIFWHNSNKGQSSGNNNNNNNSNQQAQQQQKSSSAPTDTAVNKKPMSSNTSNPKKQHWMKIQQLSSNKPEQSTAPINKSEEIKPPQSTTTAMSVTNPEVSTTTATKSTTVPSSKKSSISSSNITKKDAAKKAAMEIHRKKQGLLEEQIQQQKLLLKKLELAETSTEKESIRALMKQVDVTIVKLKDSLRLTSSIKPSTTAASGKPATVVLSTNKISQQDLKQRAQTLQKQIESLRAKTSADMRRAMSSTISQSTLNFANVLHETNSTIKSSIDKDLNSNEQKSFQITIKNIQDLPKNELEEFLKKSGATKIQSIDDNNNNSLVVIYSSQSDIDNIQKTGLKFKDIHLDISTNDDSLLNTSGKKRTLSETLEDELLGITSTETINNNANEESESKKRQQNQTSDTENDEIDEYGDDEERLLADNEKSTEDNESERRHHSFDNNDEVSQHDEFESNDIIDDIQFFDS